MQPQRQYIQRHAMQFFQRFYYCEFLEFLKLDYRRNEYFRHQVRVINSLKKEQPLWLKLKKLKKK